MDRMDGFRICDCGLGIAKGRRWDEGRSYQACTAEDRKSLLIHRRGRREHGGEMGSYVAAQLLKRSSFFGTIMAQILPFVNRSVEAAGRGDGFRRMAGRSGLRSVGIICLDCPGATAYA